MICLTTGRAWFYNQRRLFANSLQQWRPIFEKLRRVKFLRIEIMSYDCVVTEGYRTRTKKSYRKLSFHWSAIGSWLSKKKPHSFKYGTRLSAVYAKWHWSMWYQILSVSCLSFKKNVTLCLAMTARSVS